MASDIKSKTLDNKNSPSEQSTSLCLVNRNGDNHKEISNIMYTKLDSP